MKDLEKVKEMILTENGTWSERNAIILSLITTIESQKEEISDLKAELVSVGKVAAIGLKKNDPYDMKLSLQAIEMAVDHLNE